MNNTNNSAICHNCDCSIYSPAGCCGVPSNHATVRNLSARNIMPGDKVFHIATWFVCTDVMYITEALTFKKLVELTLEGYGIVSVPAVNTMRVISK